MTYELAKKLKDAGFPQNPKEGYIYFPTGQRLSVQAQGTLTVLKMAKENGESTEVLAYFPTLSELIEACGDDFGMMSKTSNGQWQVTFPTWKLVDNSLYGSTPEEAVANLWLALNTKS